MKTTDDLIAWLRDAYAMERSLELSLEKQANNETLPPEFRERARLHREETRIHAQALQGCLARLGSDPSTIKTGLAEVMEFVKGFSTAFASDECIKDALSSYAAEHYEIACYTALRAGAAKLGATFVVEVCDQILPDEELMAQWLRQHLPKLVVSYLVEEGAAAG